METWGPTKPLGTSSMVVKKGKKWEKIEKHTNNNKKELNIFPLIMECFDKLKFCRLIEAILNGPSTLFSQNALIERLYNRYKF